MSRFIHDYAECRYAECRYAECPMSKNQDFPSWIQEKECLQKGKKSLKVCRDNISLQRKKFYNTCHSWRFGNSSESYFYDQGPML